MNESFIQLGATFLIAMSLVEIIKILIGYMIKNPNGSLTNQLNMIGSNHLTHIYDELKRQTEQHERTIELLIEIKTRIK